MSVGTIYRLFSVQHSLTYYSFFAPRQRSTGNMAVAKRHQVNGIIQIFGPPVTS